MQKSPINFGDTVDYHGAVYQVVEKHWTGSQYQYTIVPYKRIVKDYRVVRDNVITYLPTLEL